jgi:hypothetical protein
MPVKHQKGRKGTADTNFSKAVRSIGYCEACKRREGLTCAHIISRRYTQTRCSFQNALCLCFACHRYYEDHPYEFARFVDTTWARNYVDDMRVIAHSTTAPKVDWSERNEIAKKVIKGIISLAEARQLNL